MASLERVEKIGEKLSHSQHFGIGSVGTVLGEGMLESRVISFSPLVAGG